MPTQALFRAKVLMPAARDYSLLRERLTEPIARLPGGNIAVVQAPAGYGKTTVIAEAALACGAQISWVNLDAFDQDATTFLQYLSLASGLSDLDPLQKDHRDVLAELCAMSPSDSRKWIVLDDVHAIDGSTEVLSLIDYLANNLTENLNLVLVGRTPPALPSLARLRVQSRVLDIGPDELTFTIEEIVALSAQIDQAVSPERANVILSETNGWPVAVSLAFAGSAHSAATLSSFISGEVMRGLPQDTADFLVKSSVLDILEAPVCDFLLDRTDSAAVLAEMERRNVPIVRLGVDQYRLHDVVRMHLHDELSVESTVFRSLHNRAAEWALEHGMPEVAIQHIAEAQDWQRAMGLITQQAPEAYKEGRWHAITAWLGLLPNALRRRNPNLLAWECRILIRFGQVDDALQVIEQFRAGPSRIPPVILAEVEALSAAAFRIKGDFDSAIVLSRRSLEISISEDASLSVVGEAHKQLGMALFGRGAYEEATSELTAARDVADRRGDREESAICNACLGSSMDALGRFTEASVYLERACELWRQVGNTKELSWTLNNLAMTLFQSGQLETARELFLEALSKARESDYRRAELYALASIADLDRYMGDLGSALREYRDSLPIAVEISEASLYCHLLAGLSEVQRRQGNLDDAKASATKALTSAQTRHSDHDEAVAHAALAEICQHKGDLEGALKEVERAQSGLNKLGPSRELMEVLLLRGGLLLESRKQRAELLDVLSRLADLISSTGLRGLLVQVGRRHLRLLEYGASRRIAGRFYHELFRDLESSDRTEPLNGGAFPTIEIRSLGELSVSLDARVVQDAEWESDKSKALLLLLLHSGRPLARDEIIAALWPDAGGRKANSVFHSSMYRLRKALYHGAVVQTSGAYSINSDGVFRWDVTRFRQLVEMNAVLERDADGLSLENLHAAVELYGGPFAPDLDAPWADGLRTELESLFVDAASRLVEKLLLRGDGDGALKVSTRLLTCDPFSESVCRKVIQSAAVAGRLGTAHRTYERFREMLLEELGEAPSEALQAYAEELFAAI